MIRPSTAAFTFVLVCTVTVAVAENERREPPQTAPTPAMSADEFLTRAALLASDEFVGRESGTEGGRMTEEYIAAELERMGLEPLGPEGSFFQDVPLPTRNPDPTGSTLTVLASEGAPSETIGEPRDVVPFAFSAGGTAEGQVAFAGFGLTDAQNEYDDYVGLEIAGKVALILRHAPQETREDSPWAKRGRAARFLSFTAKAARAAEAGAVAILMVNDYNHEEDTLPVTVRGRTSKVPVLAVSRMVAERLFVGSGTTLRDLQAQIDADRQPRSRLLETRVSVTASIESQTARNVVAVRRGSEAERADEAVVFCAHMDHVGMGWFGSPAGGGEIHNGADDNASGTAALLEAAEWLVTQPATPRSIVIAFWAGEEKGLVGSRHFAAKPLWPLEDTVACVNMDMVGRYRAQTDEDGGIHIGGAPTGSTFTSIVEALATEEGARFTHTWDAWEQSDHYAFYAKDIPSLFFTTGLHKDYHRPTDDWWLLNAEGAVLVARVAARTVRRLASEAAPEFKQRPPRPVLGVRLGDDPQRKGALMGMIFPGMGASKAGMKQGDLVVAWNGVAVESSKQLGALIGAGKAGDVVTVTIERGGERLDLEVTLSGR